eukprot:495400-Rhodomonas_salina.1
MSPHPSPHPLTEVTTTPTLDQIGLACRADVRADRQGAGAPSRPHSRRSAGPGLLPGARGIRLNRPQACNPCPTSNSVSVSLQESD